MPKGSLHVVQRDGKWAVRRSGSNRASRRYDTQEEAIKEGKKIASRDRTGLFIHRKDGRIRGRDSCGSSHFSGDKVNVPRR